MRFTSFLGLLVVLVSVAGCPGSDPGVAGPPAGDAGTATRDSGSPSADTGLPPGEPTYYGVVDDLLAEHCWGCHSAAGGGIAPFVLDDYDSARMHAGPVAAATQARRMPPFSAVNDGSCRTFEDHGRWLSDEEISILGTWALNGAPEGDPSAAPPMVMPPPHITAPDVTLAMPSAFTPALQGTNPNEMRCFVVDPGVTSDAFVTAYEVLPGTASVVHHVIVYEPETDADATTAAGLQMSDGRPGYECNGGPAVPAHPIALWAPGGHRTDYPAGTGLGLPAGRSLVIQVHYNMSSISGAIPSDQTSIVFETVPTVTRPAVMMLLSQNSLSLAPHMPSVSSTPRELRVPANGLVWGVFPHMHVMGRHLGLTLSQGGTESCALDVEGWDFNWQQAYFYSSPISVSAGDRVTIDCTYDTSAADAITTFGEGTEDEMCLSFFYATGR